MKNKIKKIKFPNKNKYYEKDSADGYAFLGYARARLGLGYENCLLKMINRDFSLKIKNNKEASPNNKYVYTLWPCLEFLRSINNTEFDLKFFKRLNDIGVYSTGEFRYCLDEYNRAIPNATSAAAYLYTLLDKKKFAQRLLNKIEEWQDFTGSWKFIYFKKNIVDRYEDPFHVAMMVYQIYCSSNLLNINVEEVLKRAYSYLVRMNDNKIYKGKIGWGVPMLYVAMACYGESNFKNIKEKLITNYINHENFRTRSYAAWALVRHEELLKGDICL